MGEGSRSGWWGLRSGMKGFVRVWEIDCFSGVLYLTRGGLSWPLCKMTGQRRKTSAEKASDCSRLRDKKRF